MHLGAIHQEVEYYGQGAKNVDKVGRVKYTENSARLCSTIPPVRLSPLLATLPVSDKRLTVYSTIRQTPANHGIREIGGSDFFAFRTNPAMLLCFLRTAR